VATGSLALISAYLRKTLMGLPESTFDLYLAVCGIFSSKSLLHISSQSIYIKLYESI
jgi:hypothetical protein